MSPPVFSLNNYRWIHFSFCAQRNFLRVSYKPFCIHSIWDDSCAVQEKRPTFGHPPMSKHATPSGCWNDRYFGATSFSCFSNNFFFLNSALLDQKVAIILSFCWRAVQQSSGCVLFCISLCVSIFHMNSRCIKHVAFFGFFWKFLSCPRANSSLQFHVVLLGRTYLFGQLELKESK